MEGMTPRRQVVLGMIVRSYIDSAQPVGSKAFVAEYGLDVSSATIRNEMAALEAMGYLTHPHTSAGRIPTEIGYRFFVEHLLGETELPLAEKYMIRHQFHQVRFELDQWVRLATAILAHTTRKAAVAIPPHAQESRLKHVELIGLRDALVLLVLVLQGGTVKQQMLFLDQVLDQEVLSRLSNQLNDELDNMASGEILAHLEALPALGSQLAQVVVQLMDMVDGRADEAIYREGLAHILSEPEFAEGQQVRQMVQVIEGRGIVDMITAASQPLEVGGVRILIGSEGGRPDFNELSLVFSRYGVQGGATGLLGVVGPVRMTYGRTIGAVRYVAQLMSDLIQDWYGTQEESGLS